MVRAGYSESLASGFIKVNESLKGTAWGWSYQKLPGKFVFSFIRNVNGYGDIKGRDSRLNRNETLVLEIVEGLEEMTRLEMATRLGISEKTVARAIASLMEKGLIKRVGSRKTGRYIATLY